MPLHTRRRERGRRLSAFEVRAACALCLLLFLWTAARAVEDPELARYDRARVTLRTLLDRFEYLFPAGQQGLLRDSLQQFNVATGAWAQTGAGDHAAVARQRAACESAMARLLGVLDVSPETERLWLPAGKPGSFTVERRWKAPSGVLLLRVSPAGAEQGPAPDFRYTVVDMARSTPPVLEIDPGVVTYSVVSFENLPPGASRIPLQLAAGGRVLAEVAARIELPRSVKLSVRVRDEASGQPTAAAVGLYTGDDVLVVPEQAISFADAGFRYDNSGRVRPYTFRESRHWPGGPRQRQVFFVDGDFEVTVPEGTYQLLAAKGYEYEPVARTITVKGAEAAAETTLRRWVDMPSRGWYSGDGHVHYARAGEAANHRLMTWARAEDVHLVNVVRMGDALETYYEQYAFGKPGRYQAGDYAVVPGQEDPRTSTMGHTLHLNILSAFRRPEQYYFYDLAFEETRRQGGLTGYAHAYQPAANSFWVRQDMTMNIPRGLVDFAEISEFGEIDDRQYYEFLNLGFKLTASAGSDVPWGGSIGTSRVYAYLGGPFSPDAWFAALKAGRTFVTTGPMLELTVNGEPPGSDVRVEPGAKVRVRAKASGKPVPPVYLEVISQGEVLRSTRKVAADGELAVEFEMPADRSTWITARCAGAQTSPVYVRVGDQRFWNLERMPALVRARMEQLDAVEALLAAGTPPGREGTWNNPPVLRAAAAGLRERVAAARAFYAQHLREAGQARSRTR